jgi:hypothetical protein
MYVVKRFVGHKPWGRVFIPWFVSSQTNTIVATNHIQNLGMYVVKRFVGHKPWKRGHKP